METANELLQKDMAFRARAMSAATEAVNEYKDQFNHEHDAMNLAYGVAFYAAGMALKRAFDDDAEISRLRFEVEHYKSAALRIAILTPPNLITIPAMEVE